MLAKDLITEDIPPLKTSDLGSEALVFMQEFHVTHLPIVNNKQFLGLISEQDIIDLNESKTPLGNHKLSLINPFVNSNQHLYEVINLVARLKLSLIPVVDEDHNYIGIITLKSIIENLSLQSSIKEPGGIIILEMGFHDYALSEIARIVESNGAKILSTFIDTDASKRTLRLTLKVNKLDLKHIIATFERFKYNVIETFMEDTHDVDSFKDRYDILMKYLNM